MRSDARRNRERLLAAAMATFVEHGADDISLEQIARRAGVGIGTLYRHFPTRQSLLESVYRDQVETLCAQAKALQADPSPGAALTTWLRALVAFSLNKRTLTAGLLGGSGKPGESAGKNSPLMSACRDDMTDAASTLLGRAKEAGLVRPDVEVADLLRLTHGVVAATERLPEQTAEAERLLDIVLGGVWHHAPDGG
jgi:AcrR family transcriptional regulator